MLMKNKEAVVIRMQPLLLGGCSELTSPCIVAAFDVVTHHAFVIEFVHLLACY